MDRLLSSTSMLASLLAGSCGRTIQGVRGRITHPSGPQSSHHGLVSLGRSLAFSQELDWDYWSGGHNA